MAGNLVKEVMLKITGNDGDTEAKLDAISRKADELARKHPEIKVKAIGTAATAAKLAVLRKELKDTGKQAEETQSRFGALGQALNIGLLGGISGGIGEMSMFQKVMMGLNVATGLGEPLVAGLAVAAGGLASAFAAAGAGLGVFGEVAKGVFSGISKNIAAAETAQQAIASGDTGKKLAADNKALAASLKGLTASQKDLVLGTSNADLEWHKFTTSAASGVASVLVPALGLVPKVLSLMKPFLAPVESALRGIVASVSKGLDSSGLSKFIAMLSKNTGPAITDLAKAIGNIGKGIGGILTAFMPVSHGLLSGLDKITAKFAAWGSTLSGHSGFKDLMHMFQTETPLAVGVLKNLAGIIKTVVSQMTGMSTFSNSKMLLQLALPFLKLANSLLKAHPELVWLVLYLKLAADGGKKVSSAITGVSAGLSTLKKGRQYLQDFSAGFGDAEKAADDATGAAGNMGGKFSSVFSSVGNMAKSAAVKMGLMTAATEDAAVATEEETGAQTELDAAMDANPIGLIIIAVAALVIGIVELWKHSTGFRNFWKGAWKDIKAAAVDAWHLIDATFKEAVATISATIAWFSRLPGYFHNWFFAVYHAIVNAWQAVYGFIKQAPGKILGFLASLPGKMLSLGQNIVMGLVHGIENMFGDVASAVGHLASLIPHGIESLLHMHSPSRVTFQHGQMIGQGLVNGMNTMHNVVFASAQRLAKAATPTGYGAPGSGSGGGTEIVFRFQPTGDAVTDAIGNSLRGYVRRKGGGGATSVQRAFGQVA